MITSSLVLALTTAVVYVWPVLKLFLDLLGVFILLLFVFGLVRLVAWVVKRPLN